MSNKFKVSAAEFLAGVGAAGSVMATAAALLGSNLVVVALTWDHPPTAGGIVTITFLMMISFVAFINVLHQLMRSEYIVSRLRLVKDDEEASRIILLELEKISIWSRIMHITGLRFTMVAFWIISYKYLISIIGYYLIILLLPFVLFVLLWIPKLSGLEKEKSMKSRETVVQLIFDVVFLVLICLDFVGVIIIL